MSVIEQLETHLESATEEWREAIEDGDEKAAAYALGKKSAFITAIEEANDWYADTETQHDGGDEYANVPNHIRHCDGDSE